MLLEKFSVTTDLKSVVPWDMGVQVPQRAPLFTDLPLLTCASFRQLLAHVMAHAEFIMGYKSFERGGQECSERAEKRAIWAASDAVSAL